MALSLSCRKTLLKIPTTLVFFVAIVTNQSFAQEFGKSSIKQCLEGYAINKFGECADVNECLIPDICKGLTCQNTNGSYYCVEDYQSDGNEEECEPGYKFVKGRIWGGSCVDIDECKTSDVCPNQECVNTKGSYECRPKTSKKNNIECPVGFEVGFDGTKCKDIDECSRDLFICDTEKQCINTQGSFKCVSEEIGSGNVTCDKGFEKSYEGVCEDIDECKSSDACPDQECVNTKGSYQCKTKAAKENCPVGFEEGFDGTKCKDIDECSDDLFICGTEKQCINTQGSFKCVSEEIGSGNVTCDKGFEKSYEGVCEDIDECKSSDACPDQECVNTKGSFECRRKAPKANCLPGYREGLDRTKCEDINECLEKLHFCGTGKRCVNTVGSYECIVDKIETQKKTCDPGFQKNYRGVCEDIDECVENANICGIGKRCKNTEGSFECILEKIETEKKTCDRGFRKNYRGVCEDIDECVENANICGIGKRCKNTEGSFECMVEKIETEKKTCDQGFRKNYRGVCKDIDECVENIDVCRTGKRCKNTVGSFECIVDKIETRKETCHRGFRKNYRGVCEDIDECVENIDVCGIGKRCKNTEGSYECIVERKETEKKTCDRGFRKNYRGVCEDIDECFENANCGRDKQCVNTKGSFKCIKRTSSLRPPYVSTTERQTSGWTKVTATFSTTAISTSTTPSTASKSRTKDSRTICRPVEEKDSNGNCRDKYECSNDLCKAKERCINTTGSYECICKAGYYKSSRGCLDIDECRLGFDICDGYRCINKEGGYHCAAIREYTDLSMGKCKRSVCYPGFEEDSYTGLCTDIDECKRIRNACPPGETCINMEGAFICRNCRLLNGVWDCVENRKCVPGMEPSEFSFHKCVDVDECATGRHNCTSSQICDNYAGGFCCVPKMHFQ